MTEHTTGEIKKETRIYLLVFAALGVLTVVTVAVSYLHLTAAMGLIVALLIASAKGFLVAGYFMHLLSERKFIFSILILTAIFAIALVFLPLFAVANSIGR